MSGRVSERVGVYLGFCVNEVLLGGFQRLCSGRGIDRVIVPLHTHTPAFKEIQLGLSYIHLLVSVWNREVRWESSALFLSIYTLNTAFQFYFSRSLSTFFFNF